MENPQLCCSEVTVNWFEDYKPGNFWSPCSDIDLAKLVVFLPCLRITHDSTLAPQTRRRGRQQKFSTTWDCFLDPEIPPRANHLAIRHPERAQLANLVRLFPAIFRWHSLDYQSLLMSGTRADQDIMIVCSLRPRGSDKSRSRFIKSRDIGNARSLSELQSPARSGLGRANLLTETCGFKQTICLCARPISPRQSTTGLPAPSTDFFQLESR